MEKINHLLKILLDNHLKEFPLIMYDGKIKSDSKERQLLDLN